MAKFSEVLVAFSTGEMKYRSLFNRLHGTKAQKAAI
jgi:hypothetical protein